MFVAKRKSDSRVIDHRVKYFVALFYIDPNDIQWLLKDYLR